MCCLDICLQGACCCFSVCCNDICRALKQTFTLSIRQQMRLAYLLLFVLFALITLVVMYYTPGFIGIWRTYIHCPQTSLDDKNKDNLACLGTSALYRMSASLCCLFGALLLICLLRNQISKLINESFWFHKLFILIGLFIMQMWVPNSYYTAYSYLAFILSILFGLLQVFISVDLAYSWSENWVRQYTEGKIFFENLLYISSAAAYISTIIMIYNNFQWFPCAQTANVTNIITVILLSIINLLPFNTKPSILACGIVCLLVTYHTWAALTNEQGDTCNMYLNKTESFLKTEGYIGILLILVSLLYITFGESDQQDKSTKEQSMGGSLMASRRISEEEEERDEEEDEFILPDSNSDVDLEEDAIELKKGKALTGLDTAALVRKELKRLRELRNQRRMKDYYTNTYIQFHAIMMISSGYLAMVLTNYGATQIDQDINWNVYQTSDTSFLVKISFAYTTAALYLWTIAAPHILSDRQF